MKTPFANFFKKVIGREVKRPDAIIHKPEEEIKEEKRETKPPKHETKTRHIAPYTWNDKLRKIHKKRRIRNHIQARSRRINFQQS